MTEIRDKRKQNDGLAFSEMKNGTWFVQCGHVYLRVDQNICVAGDTGCRVPFNEDHIGQPVEVAVEITRNRLLITES